MRCKIGSLPMNFILLAALIFFATTISERLLAAGKSHMTFVGGFRKRHRPQKNAWGGGFAQILMSALALLSREEKEPNHKLQNNDFSVFGGYAEIRFLPFLLALYASIHLYDLLMKQKIILSFPKFEATKCNKTMCLFYKSATILYC